MQATGESTDVDWGQAYSENWEKRCCGRTGERTPLVPLQACAGWQRSSTATHIRASFCHRTGACRRLSQPLFRISRNQGVTHTTLQAKSCAKGMLRPLWKPKRNAHQLRCSSSASALIRLPMALTSGTTSAFPMVK